MPKKRLIIIKFHFLSFRSEDKTLLNRFVEFLSSVYVTLLFFLMINSDALLSFFDSSFIKPLKVEFRKTDSFSSALN